MKRHRDDADIDANYTWESISPKASESDVDLDSWFRSAGLRPEDSSQAMNICEANFVHCLADLRQIWSRGQLGEVFPHPALCSRIDAQLRASGDGSGDATMMGMEKPKPIHIKHEGVSVTCEVTPSTTIREIKEHFTANTCFGYPLERQQLVYCGRQLAKDKTVGSYGIEPYSCLYLIASKASSW